MGKGVKFHVPLPKQGILFGGMLSPPSKPFTVKK
jgi:hypothetical protein